MKECLSGLHNLKDIHVVGFTSMLLLMVENCLWVLSGLDRPSDMSKS